MGLRGVWLVAVVALNAAPPCAEAQPGANNRKRVAVIGGGMAGASTAFHLAEAQIEIEVGHGLIPPLVGKDGIEIVVFEKSSEPGGRAHDIIIVGSGAAGNTKVETGASIFIRDNAMMIDLADKMSLTLRKMGDEDSTGIFLGSGQGFAFSQGGTLMTIARVLWRYGLSPMWANKEVKRVVKLFSEIYGIVRAQPFHDVLQLMSDLGLAELLDVSLDDHLVSVGVSRRYIDEIAAAITRCNYGQFPSEINAFAGLVGLAGSGSDLFQLVEGNAALADRLLKKSKARVVLGAAVGKIVIRDQMPGGDGGDGGAFLVEYEVDGARSAERFDAVVVATPFCLSGIEIKSERPGGIHNPPPHVEYPCNFHTCHTTFASGRLRAGYFGVGSAAELPDEIYSAATNKSVISISAVPGVSGGGDGAEDPLLGPLKTFKIFSSSALGSGYLNKILDSPKPIWYRPWKAYPKLPVHTHFVRLPPTVVAPCLFHTGALEHTASAMEIALIAGLNGAGLVAECLGAGHHPNAQNKAPTPGHHVADEL